MVFVFSEGAAALTLLRPPDRAFRRDRTAKNGTDASFFASVPFVTISVCRGFLGRFRLFGFFFAAFDRLARFYFRFA